MNAFGNRLSAKLLSILAVLLFMLSAALFAAQPALAYGDDEDGFIPLTLEASVTGEFSEDGGYNYYEFVVPADGQYVFRIECLSGATSYLYAYDDAALGNVVENTSSEDDFFMLELSEGESLYLEVFGYDALQYALSVSEYDPCDIAFQDFFFVKGSDIAYVYDGAAVTPEFLIYNEDEDEYLVEGTDYSVTYQNNTAVGTGKVIVTGLDPWTGTLVRTFAICSKYDLSAYWANSIPYNVLYTGSAITPEIKVCRQDGTGTALVCGTDYKVAYSDNTAVGMATATVTGLSPYSGTIECWFQIHSESDLPAFTPLTLDTAAEVVVLPSDFTYFTFTAPAAGQYIFSSSGTTDPYVDVYGDAFFEDETFIGTDDDSGDDRNFSLKTTLAAGQTVYVRVRVYYEDDYNVPFSITVSSYDPTDISNLRFEYNPGPYFLEGTSVTPSVEVYNPDTEDYLVEGTDFSVLYQSNTAIGTGKIIITGLSPWTGSKVLEFKICDEYDLEAYVAHANPYHCIYTGSPITPDVVISANGGEIVDLRLGTDYTLAYGDNTDIGTATITVTALSPYRGTLECEFEICDPSDAPEAETLSLDAGTESELPEYDSAYFKFTAPSDGGYIFFAESETETWASAYSDPFFEVWVESRNMATDDGNFRTMVSMVKNQTLYLRVSGDEGDIPIVVFVAKYDPLDISNFNVWTYEQNMPFVYTGSIIKPGVQVSDSQTYQNLREGTDYTVEYLADCVGSPTKIVQGTVRVTGKGNYHGVKEVHFTIKPYFDLADMVEDNSCEVLVDGEELEYVYPEDSSADDPYYFAILGDTALMPTVRFWQTGSPVAGVDFTVTYETAAGVPCTSINAAGNYAIVLTPVSGGKCGGDPARIDLRVSDVLPVGLLRLRVSSSTSSQSSQQLKELEGRPMSIDYAFRNAEWIFFAGSKEYVEGYDYTITREKTGDLTGTFTVSAGPSGAISGSITCSYRFDAELSFASFYINDRYASPRSFDSAPVLRLDASGNLEPVCVTSNLVQGVDYAVGGFRDSDRAPMESAPSVPGSYYIEINGLGAYAGSSVLLAITVQDASESGPVDLSSNANLYLPNALVNPQTGEYASLKSAASVPVIVYDRSDGVLVEGTDFTKTVSTGLGGNSLTILVEGIESAGYTGSISVNVTLVDKFTLGSFGGFIQENKPFYLVDGQASITDQVGAYRFNAATLLQAGTDYTLSFAPLNESGEVSGSRISAIASPGRYRMYATGTGNWTGEIYRDITVSAIPDQISLSQCDITLDASEFLFDNTAKTPKVTVRFSGKTYVEDVDYTVDYSNNVQVGRAYALVTAKEGATSLKGSKAVPFAIVEKYSLPVETSYYYVKTADAVDYTPYEPRSLQTVTIEAGGAATLDIKIAKSFAYDAENGWSTASGWLVKDTDYTVTFSNNTSDGMALATIQGIGDYAGTAYVNFLVEVGQIHVHVKGQVVRTVSPKCLEGGYTVYLCSDCGKEFRTDETAALGHNLTHHAAQAATCTEVGWDAYDDCDRCTYTTYVEKPALGHDYANHEGQPATCTEAGWEPYRTCNRCDYTSYVEIPAHHTWDDGTVTKDPTYVGEGEMTYACTREGCEATKTEAVPMLPKTALSACTVTLSKTAFVYDGKAKVPAVTVKLNGVKLVKDVDYTVAFYNASGTKVASPKAVGAYKVKVTAKSGNVPVSGSVVKAAAFKVNPPATAIRSLAKGTKSFKVTWTKKTAQVTGYQIRYSLKSSMASSKTATVTSYKTTAKTVKSLKAKKKYYVQVRTYKTVKGVKYYSAWSAKKAVTTK